MTWASTRLCQEVWIRVGSEGLPKLGLASESVAELARSLMTPYNAKLQQFGGDITELVSRSVLTGGAAGEIERTLAGMTKTLAPSPAIQSLLDVNKKLSADVAWKVSEAGTPSALSAARQAPGQFARQVELTKLPELRGPLPLPVVPAAVDYDFNIPSPATQGTLEALVDLQRKQVDLLEDMDQRQRQNDAGNRWIMLAGLLLALNSVLSRLDAFAECVSVAPRVATDHECQAPVPARHFDPGSCLTPRSLTRR